MQQLEMQHTTPETRQSRWFIGVWILSVFLFLVAPVAPTMSSRPSGLLAALVWAAFIRGVYIGIRALLNKRGQVRFWHPWLFGTAAILSLLVFMGSTASAA